MAVRGHWDTIKKFLSTPHEWSGQQNFNEVAIISASNSTAWNLDIAQAAVHVMTENTDIAEPTNINAGGTYILRIVQAAGVYSLTWDSAFDFGGESDPAEPAANGDLIIVSFYSDGSVMYGTEVLRKEA